MKKKTVIFGPFANESFTKGLTLLLSNSGTFRILTIGDPDTLVSDMVEEPATLILEGTDPSVCRRYLALDAVHRVVLIDMNAAMAFIGLHNPRWEDLAGIITTIVDDIDVRDEDRVRVLDANTLNLDRPANVGTGDDDLKPLMRWIELCLGWRLFQHCGDDDSSGVLGWSVSYQQALDMLDVDPHGTVSSAEGESLEARLRRCDNSLFMEGRTLPRIIACIRDTFALTVEDLRFLGLVLAPEIDGRYAMAIGVLQNDLTRCRPSLTLMAELMPDADVTTWHLRRRLHRPDSLLTKGLIRVETVGVPVDAALLPSAAVVAHLLSTSPDQAASSIGAEWWPLSTSPEPPLSVEESSLTRQLEPAKHNPGPVRLMGGDQSKQWFRRVASAVGLAVLVGNFDAVDANRDRVAAMGDWCILCHILDGALLLLGTDGLTMSERVQISEIVKREVNNGQFVAVDGEVMHHCRETRRIVLAAPETSAAQRSAWWSTAARQVGLLLNQSDTDRLAATVNLEPHAFVTAAGMAVRLAAASVDGALVELVQRSARSLSSCEIPDGARCIDPIYGWDDMVIGDENRILLESIPHHVLYAGHVMEEWGFGARMAYGRGIAALFSGPSGTGKTMAAQVIAKELGVDLLQVDLSKTVSKYIGETEKNLDKVFVAAECRGSVLLFDEADAIFGRRTEIKDAHDRHANVEVAYLLQRLEEFRGLSILTTNLKQNIDNAFVRRLRFVVDFALPTAAQRAEIWSKAFPEGVLAERGLDMATVASRLPIAGGSIQNIALHAAFLAAAADERINAGHLLVAMRRELLKIGMQSAVSGLEELMLTLAGADGYDQEAAP